MAFDLTNEWKARRFNSCHLPISVVDQAGIIVGRRGVNNFTNTFAVSLNPMQGCDNQISMHIARLERVKQLAALAAALLQLLLLLLPLLLLPCPHCLCHPISAIVPCFCCGCLSSAPEFWMRIWIYLKLQHCSRTWSSSPLFNRLFQSASNTVFCCNVDQLY